jgi:hypothetical protein
MCQVLVRPNPQPIRTRSCAVLSDRIAIMTGVFALHAVWSVDSQLCV